MKITSQTRQVWFCLFAGLIFSVGNQLCYSQTDSADLNSIALPIALPGIEDRVDDETLYFRELLRKLELRQKREHKYSMLFVEPDPNADYRMLVIQPDPNHVYAMLIIDPYAGERRERANGLAPWKGPTSQKQRRIDLESTPPPKDEPVAAPD